MAKKTQIIGEKELAAKFKELANVHDSNRFEDELLEIADDLKYKIKREIKSKGLFKTGRLYRAVVAKKFKGKRKGFPAVFVANDYSIAPHAHLVERGHGGPHPAAAHPYFFRTVRRERGGLERRIQNKTWDLIKRKAME